MRNWVINNRWIIAGTLLGAIGGYIYWREVGCLNGTCMITSKWHNSAAYGGIMGALLFSIFKPGKDGNNK